MCIIVLYSDAAELVLYKSITFHSKEEHGHSTVSEIDYSYEFIEDFQDPREEWYFRLTSLFTHKDNVFEARNVALHAVESSNVSLSAIRMTSRLNSTAGNISPPRHTNVPKNRNNNWGPKKFEKKNHVIKLMVCYVCVCVCVCACTCVCAYGMLIHVVCGCCLCVFVITSLIQ